MPRLELALFGGGLRSILFHVGVVCFLRDAGLLGDVTHIVVCVSVGSILGALLALNWERYNASAAEFEAVALKILDFMRFDARNFTWQGIGSGTPLRPSVITLGVCTAAIAGARPDQIAGSDRAPQKIRDLRRR